MKKAITLVILSLFTLAAHAQRFDWVKTYSGLDLNGSETNNIVGSFVDGEGNFYFLGEFSPSATLCGVRLLPEEVVSEQYRSVVIAKLSPSGQLLWHKAIYGPQSSYAYSLCPMGDTAFTVMVGFKMSHNFNSFLYYLDTLLTSSDAGYLQSCDSTASPLTNGFITFRLDGSVAEQHFIELGYIDSTGRPLTIGLYGQPTPAPDALESTVLSSETFTIDNDGNIYIARLTKDYKYILNERFSIDDGTIATYKIMVDGSHPLLYPLEQHSALWNQQILKFSPHFDSLIESTFVFETIGLGDWESLSSKIMSMKTDAYGRLYIATEFEIPAYTIEHPVHLGIVGSDSLLLNLDSLCWVAGCLIQYTAVLIPQQIMQLNYTLGNMRLSMSSYIRDIEIDETNNSIYTLWNISGLHNGDNSMVIYHDTLIDTRNNVLWVRIDRSGFGLISYGVAKSSLFTCFEKLPVCLSIHNNRVFSQLKYVSDITVNDSTIENNNSPGYGMGAFVWDCAGNELGFYEFGQNAFSDAPGQTLAIDSTLFFTGQIFSNANFDTILLSANGNSMAYIAKYIDVSFMFPYVHQRLVQTIEWTQILSFTSSGDQIQLTAVSTSGLPITYSIEDTTIAIIRNDTLILLSEGVTHITASQSGNNTFYPADPVTRLLQVGRESVDVSNESKIHIYPNPAKDILYFVCDETTISEITVLSSDGRMTKLPYNSNSIDISTLSTGIYYLVIVSEHEVYKYKIVKL